MTCTITLMGHFLAAPPQGMSFSIHPSCHTDQDLNFVPDAFLSTSPLISFITKTCHLNLNVPGTCPFPVPRSHLHREPGLQPEPLNHQPACAPAVLCTAAGTAFQKHINSTSHLKSPKGLLYFRTKIKNRYPAQLALGGVTVVSSPDPQNPILPLPPIPQLLSLPVCLLQLSAHTSHPQESEGFPSHS